MLLWLLAGLIVLGLLVWLGFAIVRTWKVVVRAGRGVAEAGERIANASAGLEAANAAQRGRLQP